MEDYFFNAGFEYTMARTSDKIQYLYVDTANFIHSTIADRRTTTHAWDRPPAGPQATSEKTTCLITAFFNLVSKTLCLTILY